MPRPVPRRRASGNARLDRSSAFSSRERRLSLFDPSFGIHQSHTFDATQNPIAGERFPVELFLSPITIAVEIIQTGASPTGVIFAYGDDLTGIAVWLEGQDVGIAAGGPATNGIGGIRSSVLKAINHRVRLTFVAHPGYGAAALYVDDDLELYVTSSSGRFDGGWAKQSPGAVADSPALITSRVPAPRRVALSDASVISKVRGYERTYPRQLDSFTGETSGFSPLLPPPVTPPQPGGSFNSSFNQSFDVS